MKHRSHIPIVMLVILIAIGIFINQYGILRMSYRYKKTNFVEIVNQAIKKAVKEIDYELFEQCILHNSDTTLRENMLREFEELQSGLKKGTNTGHYHNLEEIDRYESLMLRYLVLVESTTSFNYQTLGLRFVDSVIDASFKHFSIELPYEMGLYCPLEAHFLFLTADEYEQKLLNEGLRFEVFSPKQGSIPCYDQIILYFPTLDTWISTQNNRIYTLKTILCIIYLFCFILLVIIVKRDHELSKLKNSLINNMTHELKTPVSTISLACEALQDPAVVKDETLVNTYIRIIKEENETNKDMIENVLNIFGSNKKKPANKQDTHINQDIERIVSMHKLEAENKKANIILQLEAEDDLVFADRIHISNALSNLLDNALKYSQENPEIVITTSNKSKGKIDISFKDNGIGIREREQKRVFDEFYRVDTGNIHTVKGHGLGLHYVKQVIEFHHGKIKLESKLGQGSTFFISLPLKNN